MKTNFVALIIALTIITLFSFWPSFLGAHYAGVVSCPIMMGDMSGCQSMAGHMNNILFHISDFSNMSASILNAGFWQAIIAVLLALCLFTFFLKRDTSVENEKRDTLFKLARFQSLLIRFKNKIFQGLKTGTLNTKVF